MHIPRSPPVCRRPGCADPAVRPYGFCLAHDLQYARWRTWRDDLERQDLADAGIPPGAEPDERTANALDLLWRLLTPWPFTERGA